jgi:hypothetical protein
LRQTGKPVAVVTDAIESLSPDAARRLLEDFTAAGGTLTAVDRIVSE